MKVTRETVDDILRAVLGRLLRSENRVTPTRGGIREVTGAMLELENPRARISRAQTRGKITSCIAEFLWYMSKQNHLDFIAYYLRKYREESEDGLTVYGGYGPRLFGTGGGPDQIANVIQLLKDKPTSRRAVIQVFDGDDIDGHVRKEVPCTCTLQFFIRAGRLEMIANMRSNDAYMGLPHDIFAFTMIQEVLARTLGIELGTYKHFVGSLHLYERDVRKAREYISEGWQSQKSMPPMPLERPWKSIESLIKLEKTMRSSDRLVRFPRWMESYWRDLALFLQIHSANKRNNQRLVKNAKARIRSDFYRIYLT